MSCCGVFSECQAVSNSEASAQPKHDERHMHREDRTQFGTKMRQEFGILNESFNKSRSCAAASHMLSWARACPDAKRVDFARAAPVLDKRSSSSLSLPYSTHPSSCSSVRRRSDEEVL